VAVVSVEEEEKILKHTKMGNSTSKSLPVTLSIVLDPPPPLSGNCYLAGQSISGSVYAQSKTNVPSQQQVDIRAYISGK